MGDLRGTPLCNHFEDEPSSTNERFASERERLKTFQEFNWPSTAPVPSESLARAGFVYTGVGLTVRCFSCSVTCAEWDYGQTAFKKHRELNRNCSFVRQQADIIRDPAAPFERPVNHGHMDHGASMSLPVMAHIAEYQRFWPNEHHAFNKESARRSTFVDWPLGFVRPEDLARIGFVYLKTGDRVQCVFCLGIVTDWEPGDVPLQEHGRHFPSCPFIRGSTTNNVSIEDEFRGQLQPLDPNPISPRGFDVCGIRPLNMNSFKPERFKLAQPLEAFSELNIIGHSPPKYPSYTTKEARLRSYVTWPNGIPQEVDALVEAGLFYTGMSDHVKCFQCGGGLKNWDLSDVPFEEHARWFPDCPFVNLSKGKEFIERVKKQKPPILLNSPTEPQIMRNPREISEQELDAMMASDLVKAVLDMGLNHYLVREALKRRWYQAGYSFADSDSLAQAVLELGGVQQTSMGDVPNLVRGPEEVCIRVEEASTSEASGSSSAITIQMVEPINRPVCGNTINGTVSGADKCEVMSPENEFRLCKVCMDQEMSVVFLPCGHFVACATCAAQMSNCPVCRADIKGKVRTYWP